MKNIIDSAIRIIKKMEREKLPVRAFIAKYQELFAGVDKRSLIPPECREHDIYTETAYVFVVGSYIYQHIECRPVTWFERRRFAEFQHYPELFKRTLSSSPKRRFQRLSELKEYLNRLI